MALTLLGTFVLLGSPVREASQMRPGRPRSQRELTSRGGRPPAAPTRAALL